MSRAVLLAGATTTPRRIVEGFRQRYSGDRVTVLVFPILASIFGLYLLLNIPPSQVLDERTHFLRAWQLSNFNIVADKAYFEPAGVVVPGEYIDLCVVEYIDQFAGAASKPDSYSRRAFWNDTPDCKPQRRGFVHLSAGTNYGPWAYPGQIAGLMIGRAIGLPLPVTFFLGRLGSLALYVGLITTALRVTPRCRTAMMFIGLLPMSLLTAVAYQSDGIMTAGSILGSALVMRNCVDPPDSTRRRRFYFVAAFLLFASMAATKPNYIVVSALLLAVPSSELGLVRRWRLLPVAALAGLALAVVAWSAATSGTAALESGAGADAGGQVRFLLDHPTSVVSVIRNTAYDYTNEVFVLRGWPGVYGMLRSGRPNVAPVLPVVYVAAAALVGLAAVLKELGPRLDLSRARRRSRWAIAFTLLIVAPLLVLATTYLLWTPVGAPTAVGLQGRYFLPLVIPAAGSIALLRKPSDLAVGPLMVTILATVLFIRTHTILRDMFY